MRLLQPDPTTEEFRPFVQPHSRVAFEELFLEGKPEWLRDVGAQDLFFVGADVVDGSYGADSALKRIDLARQSAEKWADDRIFLSFSFSGRGPHSVESAFSSLSGAEFFPRDSVSWERFVNRTGQSGAVVTHDLAFLCPKTRSDQIDDIHVAIREARREKRTIIGMNFSTHAIDHLRHRSAEQARCDLVALICDQVVQSIPNCFIAFISSDIRHWENMPSDQTLAQLAAEWLDKWHPGLPKIVCSHALDYPALVTLVEELDFVIGGRMHLAIAALRGRSIGRHQIQRKTDGVLP